jgi:hypothetical protein
MAQDTHDEVIIEFNSILYRKMIKFTLCQFFFFAASFYTLASYRVKYVTVGKSY